MTIEITFLGGSGFRLRSNKTCLLVDPYWGSSPRKGIDRRQPPPFPAQDLYDTQYVLSTHSHLDHCDPRLLRLLHDNSQAQFMGPPSSVATMAAAGLTVQRIFPVIARESLSLGDFSVTVGPGNDPLEPQAITFHLVHADTAIFHSGDSLYSDIYKRAATMHRVDVALLNFGRRLYMSAQDVIQAAHDLGCQLCVPMHWDLWAQFYRSPEGLKAKCQGAPFEVVPLVPGESLVVARNQQGYLQVQKV